MNGKNQKWQSVMKRTSTRKQNLKRREWSEWNNIRIKEYKQRINKERVTTQRNSQCIVGEQQQESMEYITAKQEWEGSKSASKQATRILSVHTREAKEEETKAQAGKEKRKKEKRINSQETQEEEERNGATDQAQWGMEHTRKKKDGKWWWRITTKATKSSRRKIL